jgi:hypothetical protein
MSNLNKTQTTDVRGDAVTVHTRAGPAAQNRARPSQNGIWTSPKERPDHDDRRFTSRSVLAKSRWR